MKEDMKYIHGLKKNNSKVIQSIYDQYLPIIQTFITKNNGTKDEAWDIFQEGLILILKKSKKKDFELKSKFSSYLYGICKFLWMNKLRKKSGNEVTITDTMTYTDDYSIEEDLHQTAQKELFLEKFRELGEKCQKVLNLYFNKTKMEEIARLMSYASVNATKQRKHKCTKQLITKIRTDHRYNELRAEDQIK